MIVQCEKCNSRFRLDETLLKEGGSKVRCSSCRHVFVAYPPSETSSSWLDAEPETPSPVEEPEETVILDSPTDLSDAGMESPDESIPSFSGSEAGAEEALDDEFDFALEQDLEENPEEEGDQEIVAVSPEDLPALEAAREERAEAMEHAPKDRVSLTRDDSMQEEGAVDREWIAEATEPVGKAGRRSAFLPVLLGFLVLLGIGAAAVLFFAPGVIPDSLDFIKPTAEKQAEDPGVRKLTFEGVKGSFVRTEQGKRRFVVRGTVVNNYSGPRSFVRIKTEILDGKGQTVRSLLVYAGNAFSGGELRGKPINALEADMKRRTGKDNTNVNIPPGGTIPFMAVFQGLPESISEFTVEAVSSAPGQNS
ncbi:MAG: DUF3426 domain-containing protein [Desulfobacteraceae bacterium]|jgi:predicted Zn finger-like uncharacterized protein